jgi:DNA polymerase
MTDRQHSARRLLSELERQIEALERAGVRWVNVPGAPAAPAAPTAPAPAQPAVPTAPAPAQPAAPPAPARAAPPPASAARPHPSAVETLESLRLQTLDCAQCKLCETRTQVVFGVGSDRPRILFIGEGPGADEDAQGEPFVGRAGRLLTGLILAMGLVREDVYITNVVKCRPPENRNPEPAEIASCRPILQRQIELLDPRLIVTLGNVPLKALHPQAGGITRARGTPFTYQRWQVLPTFHPSYLLRNPAAIDICWRDFRSALHAAYAEP